MNLKKIFVLFLLFLVANLLLGFLIMANHRVVSGLNPYIGPIMLLVVSLAITPFVIKGYKWFKKNKFTDTRNEIAILFGFGALCWLIRGLPFLSLLFGMLSAFYYFFPRIFKRELNISFSRIHFWISYGGLYLLTWTSYHAYDAGEPRHYIDTAGRRSFELFQTVNRQLSAIAVLLFTAQLLFLFNIMYTLFKRNTRSTTEAK